MILCSLVTCLFFGKYRHRKLGKQYWDLDVSLMLSNFKNISGFITIKYFTECFSIFHIFLLCFLQFFLSNVQFRNIVTCP